MASVPIKLAVKSLPFDPFKTIPLYTFEEITLPSAAVTPPIVEALTAVKSIPFS